MMSTLLMFATALTLSGVAAWFSIVGLIAIFSAAPISVAVMAGSLEAAKLVCASWVYNNWRSAPLLIRSYLTLAVLILMFITSLGIFGYLSKAHLEQRSVGAETQLILERLNQDVDTKETQLQRLLQTEDRLNAAIDRMVERDRVTQALSQRRRLQSELAAIADERKVLQSEIDALQTQRIPLELETKKLELEIGPLKYIAELVYGDQAKSHFDQAVRFVIILLVVVFDPLAVAMLIAANFSLRAQRPNPIKPEDTPQETPQATPPISAVSVPLEPVPATAPAPSNLVVHTVLDSPTIDQALEEVERMPEIRDEQIPTVQEPSDPVDTSKLSLVKQGINQRVTRLGPGYASFDGKPISDTARRENPLDFAHAAVLVEKLVKDELSVSDLSWNECDAVLKYLENDKPTNLP